MTRLVEVNDLELYAINTGEFYALHKALVGKPVETWVRHLLDNVAPHYCRKIEPIEVNLPLLVSVANHLRDYYTRHAAETVALKQASGSNVTPIRPAKLMEAHRIVQSAIGQPFVVLAGNPAEGFSVIGPFNTAEAAGNFLDADSREGWIVPLTSCAETPAN